MYIKRSLGGCGGSRQTRLDEDSQPRSNQRPELNKLGEKNMVSAGMFYTEFILVYCFTVACFSSTKPRQYNAFILINC